MNKKSIVIKLINKHFNKKLKITTKEENNFQNFNDCWICTQKVIKNKVRDHYHITGKYEVLHVKNAIQN